MTPKLCGEIRKLREKLDKYFLDEMPKFGELLFEIEKRYNFPDKLRIKAAPKFPFWTGDLEEKYSTQLKKYLQGKKEILDKFKSHELEGLNEVEKIEKIRELIGDTPVVELPATLNPTESEIYLKLEYFNPLSNSLKDRPAVEILKESIDRLKNRKPMDASSGRFAVAISMVGYLLDRPAHVIVSDRVSYGTKLMLELMHEMFGTEIEEIQDKGICPAFPTDGAIAYARALAASESTKDRYCYTDQFKNENNPKAHLRTGQEILEQVDKPDAVVIGGGSGGTFGGVGTRVQERYPKTKIILVIPQKGHHQYGLRNIYEAWKPTIWTNYEERIKHEEVVMDDETAYKFALKLNKSGIYSGISGGSVTAAALREAERGSKRIVAIIPDSIEKYIMDFTNLSAAKFEAG